MEVELMMVILNGLVGILVAPIEQVFFYGMALGMDVTQENSVYLGIHINSC
jgi:hypothetical protein